MDNFLLPKNLFLLIRQILYTLCMLIIYSFSISRVSNSIELLFSVCRFGSIHTYSGHSGLKSMVRLSFLFPLELIVYSIDCSQESLPEDLVVEFVNCNSQNVLGWDIKPEQFQLTSASQKSTSHFMLTGTRKLELLSRQILLQKNQGNQER